MSDIYVIKTEQGEFINKAGAKVKSIFDAKLFKKDDLELPVWLLGVARSLNLNVQPVLFSEELKSITHV